MGMIGACIDLELADHLPAQPVLGQHSRDGPRYHSYRAPYAEVRERFCLEATRIARISVVDLVLALLRSDRHLSGIDDNDKVAGIDVRSENRLVFASQEGGDLGRHRPERRLCSVDDPPLAVDID